MTDQEAFERLKAGDMTGLDAIYVNNRELFVRWMRKQYQCPDELAMDFYQEAILQFHKNVATGIFTRVTGKIGSYLIEIGKNKWRSDQRKEQRIGAKEPEVLRTFYTDEERPDETEQAALLQQVEAALAELGEPGSTLLLLYHQDGLSYEEIVQRMGYENVDSAKTQRYKYMRRLKNILFGKTQPNAQAWNSPT